VTRSYDQIAKAFRERRHIVRGTTVCLGDEVVLGNGSVVARRDDRGVVWVGLDGNTNPLARTQLNAICHALGFAMGFFQWKGDQYFGSHDDDNPRAWHGSCRVIDPHDTFALAGPLGMLAIAAERNQQSLQ
jgi:hypothetical protein